MAKKKAKVGNSKFPILILAFLLIVFVVVISIVGEKDKNYYKSKKGSNIFATQKDEKELLKDDLIKLHKDKIIINYNSYDTLKKYTETNSFAKKYVDLYEKANIITDKTSWDKVMIEVLSSYTSLLVNKDQEKAEEIKIQKVYFGLDDIKQDLSKHDSVIPLMLFVIENGQNTHYILRRENNVQINTTLYITTQELNNVSEIDFDKMTFNGKKELFKYKNIKLVIANEELYKNANDNYQEFVDLLFFKEKTLDPVIEQEEIEEERKRQEADEQRDYNRKPSVGMTKSEVLKTYWGSPTRTTKTTYDWGTVETWYYSGRGHISFRDGIVESVSEY